MRLLKNKQAALAVLALGVGVLGCGIFGSGDGKPAPMKLSLDASARLNPDERGRPLPTVVRVYQLKNMIKMESADFQDLFRRDKEILGEDMIQVDEIEVPPGGQVRKILPREKDSRYVAIAALFRRPAGFSWRSIMELPKPSREAELSFQLDEYRVSPK
jgi:type VI secretion system protein VasD